MNWRRKILKTSIIPIYFVIIALINELITFLVLGFGAGPTQYFLNLCVILGISAIIYACTNRVVQSTLTIAITAFQLVLLITNESLLTTYGEMFNVEVFFIAGDGLSAVEISFLSIPLIITSCCLIVANIVAITLINIYILNKLIKKEKQDKITVNHPKWWTCLANFCMFLLIGGFAVGGYATNVALLSKNKDVIYAQTDNGYTYLIPVLQDNDKALYNTMQFKVAAYKKFGSFAFYFRNVVKFTQAKIGADQADVDNAIEFINNGTQIDATISKTQNGNNVIVIMMESLSYYPIDEKLTPNLFALTQGEGISSYENYQATNYYSKSKTNFSEMSGLLGAGSYFNEYTNSWSGTNNGNLAGALDFSLPNKFKEEHSEDENGCITNYLINHQKEFYSRNEVFTSDIMGFDSMYDGAGVSPDKYQYWGDWELDSVIIDSLKEELFPADKAFFTWISTMITHGPYVGQIEELQTYYDQITEFEKNGDWVNPISSKRYAKKGDAEKFKWYCAGAMDFDFMLGNLVNYLEKEGIADKTTIVLYADHEPYYYDLARTMENLKPGTFTNNAIYNLPFFVLDTSFAPTNETYKIEKFVTYCDVYATICEMLGFEYNENMCLGESIFSEEDPEKVLLCSTGGFMNSNIYSIDGTNLYFADGYTPTDDDINKFYAGINKVVFKANKIKYLFTNSIYKNLENKNGVVI